MQLKIAPLLQIATGIAICDRIYRASKQDMDVVLSIVWAWGLKNEYTEITQRKCLKPLFVFKTYFSDISSIVV